jgi:hypothetical protein
MVCAGLSALSYPGCAEHSPTDTPVSDTTALADACSRSDTIVVASIPEFVASLQHGFAFSPLSVDQVNGVIAATQALDTGSLSSASSSAARAGYRVAPLRAGSECYVLLQPTDAAPAGQALLAYAPRWTRNLVIEAPHVPEDHRTDAEAALLFVATSAKALVIAGSHRCAVTDPSGCRRSTECGSAGVAVASDPSHSVWNAVNAVHLAFRQTDAITLQLHTNFKPDLNGDVLVSNGTRYAIPGAPADALYQALKAPDIDARSCNDPAMPPTNGAFCGETNAQSLASNGAADQCLGTSSSKGGAQAHRFIHVEQNTQRMDPVEEWSARVGAAVLAAVPPTR